MNDINSQRELFNAVHQKFKEADSNRDSDTMRSAGYALAGLVDTLLIRLEDQEQNHKQTIARFEDASRRF